MGDEVIIVGLFTRRAGEEKNLPILRVGNIASMPEERVNTKFGLVEAYLVEVRSIGGLSGSPVFVFLGGSQIPAFAGGRSDPAIRVIERNTYTILDDHGGGDRFFLIGLVHAHWDIKDMEIDMANNETSKLNMGIAAIVPAAKIKEVIDQDSLTKTREEKEKAAIEKEAAVLDSQFEEGITKEEFKETLKKVSKPTSSQPSQGKKET